MVIDGAINGELFLAYVNQILLSTLHEGDVVVLDNLSSHKLDGGKEAIERVDARVLYLPPYSPDLNPIEMVLSKLKTLLRKSKLRTMEDLWNKLANCVMSLHQRNAKTISNSQDIKNKCPDLFLICPRSCFKLLWNKMHRISFVFVCFAEKFGPH